MATQRDFYDVLGIGRSASKDEIKKSYRKLARQYHPDVNKEARAEDKFKEVQRAYEVLSDDQKRNMYDTYGHAGVENGAGGFSGALKAALVTLATSLKSCLTRVLAAVGGTKRLKFAGLQAADLCIAWPSGEVGAMGLEGAVRLGARAQLERIEDEAEREAEVKGLVSDLKRRGRALNAAAHFEFDDVIDPIETRDRILQVLGAIKSTTAL